MSNLADQNVHELGRQAMAAVEKLLGEQMRGAMELGFHRGVERGRFEERSDIRKEVRDFAVLERMLREEKFGLCDVADVVSVVKKWLDAK